MILDLKLILQTQILKKWVCNLNLRATTMKLLEEKTRVNLHALEFYNGFLGVLKAEETTEKKRYWTLSEFKTLCIKGHYWRY